MTKKAELSGRNEGQLMTATNTELVKKNKALRHYEYYDMQPIFDRLYALSKKGFNHYNLIVMRRKIVPAYCIKTAK